MRQFWQSAFIQQLWKYAGAVSIRTKVLGIVLGVIILLGGVVIVQMREVLYSTLSYDLQEQGNILTSNVTKDANTHYADTDAMLAFFQERKDHYSSESHNTIVAYILLENADGTHHTQVGNVGLSQKPRTPLPTHGTHHPVFVLDDGGVFEFVHPLADADAQVRLGLSTIRITQTVNLVTLRLLSITIVAIGLGFGGAFFLTWVLTRPIHQLVEATHLVAKGNLTVRVPRWADDEIGDLAVAFNGMTASLEKAEQERQTRERLREAYISGVIVAQENERQRIARELHDSTSQSLTSLLIGLQNIKHQDSIGDISTHADQLRTIVASTLEEIRNISWQLRPSVLDDLGLVSAIEHYVNDYRQRYQLPVDMVIHGIDGRLSDELETTIYRIIQEGLTNIVRYAQAKTVSLIISSKDDKIKIILEDDGIGFDPVAVQHQKKTLGIAGIRERVALFGGTFTIESQPEHGTTLFIELPNLTESSPSS